MSKSDKSNEIKRIIVYGAGAIGGQVGGYLKQAGDDVILIDRPQHVNAIKEHGLRIITPIGTQTVRVPAVTDPAEIEIKQGDVVLLCLKGQVTEEALGKLRTLTDDAPIFCMQNGVRNEELAASQFPRVYGVELRIGGVCVNFGEIILRGYPPGAIIMGRYPTGTDTLVENLATELRKAGFKIMVTPDVMPYKWGKLMYNLGNAVNAITNIRLGDNIPTLDAIRKEAEEIRTQAGIRCVSLEELAVEWPDGTAPPLHRIETPELSSTWQSLTRKEGSVETEFLNGEIVRIAKRLGKEAPLNEAI